MVEFLFLVVGFGLGFFVNWKYGMVMAMKLEELRDRAKSKVKEWLN